MERSGWPRWRRALSLDKQSNREKMAEGRRERRTEPRKEGRKGRKEGGKKLVVTKPLSRTLDLSSLEGFSKVLFGGGALKTTPRD